MEIINRSRTGGRGKEYVKSEQKAKFNFDLSVLNLMCSYVLSRNAHIKRGNLINMRNLFESIDMSIYKNEPEKLDRINFIKRGLYARIEKDLKNPTLILSYINGGIESNNKKLEDYPEMSNQELIYIDETVSGALRSTFLDSDMDKFYELYTRYKAQDYRYRDEMNAEIEEFVSYLYNKFRRSKAEDPNTISFSLRGEEFENSISDIHDRLSSPSRYLYTTMQGMNMITVGGFECGRVYLLVGMAGVGKSMLMLNLALQMKKANKGYITKDPTKIPTIVFLTQENSVDETVDRICTMITGKGMANFSKEEIINLLRTKGELMLEGDNNININIIYKPDRSIDTGDLYTIVEDLEDDGYEVIALFQDHIKRIRSIDRGVRSDIRLELGAVVNEFKVFANIKQIPVITVSHLNRDASKTIDSSATGNKMDLTRLLGRSNVGESMLMVDNADWACIVNKEFDMEENPYLVLKRIKLRNGDNPYDYICIPFEKNNGTKLVEDLYNPTPVFKTTLIPEVQQSPTVQINGIVTNQQSYVNLNVMNDEPNMFEPLGSSYSSSIDLDTNSSILNSMSSINIEKEEKIPFIVWNN